MLLIAVSSMPIVYAEGSDIAALSAEFALAIDVEQGTVLYEKNADKKMYPASMTKIVTVLVALELIDDLAESVVITETDLETIFETGASAAYFEVGEIVTYEDLIYGAMLPSGADATRALAHNLADSYSDFVDKMNDISKNLGLVNTNFVNSTGIHDDNHYTTADDLAAILQYAIKNDDFMKVFSTYYYTTKNGLRGWLNTGMFNTTMLNFDKDYIIGCKSGYTHEAQRCLASLIMVDDREIITIVGHSDREIRGSANIDTNLIAEFIENTHKVVTIHSERELVDELPIMFGVDDLYALHFASDVNVYLPINFNNEDLEYSFQFEELKAPIEHGHEIGTLTIAYQNHEIYTQNFYVDRMLERNNISYVRHNIKIFFLSYRVIFWLALMLIILILYVKIKK